MIGHRTRLPYESSKRYLNASLKEIFVEISHNFSKFAVAAGLAIAGEKTKPPKSTADTIQRLRELKEEFEFTRQQRKRATTCYNLSNSHIKLVSQALNLIGMCFGRMRGYAPEGKIDISRCHRTYAAVKRNV
jgi:alkyl hydroperoxide reductase subunit AhpF